MRHKRSIFLTHKTRATFSKKYFEDKNAKKHIQYKKTKQKVKTIFWRMTDVE